MTSKGQMFKVNLANYPVESGVLDETGQSATTEFDVKGSIAALLFNPRLELTVPQAFEAKALVDRIQSSDGHMLVDSADMARLRHAYDVYRSPTMSALECLRRIRDAELVEVSEITPERSG